jgi:hypothetical protein
VSRTVRRLTRVDPVEQAHFGGNQIALKQLARRL